ncbi:MAG: 3-isopropylmalate dehydratase small subunit [Armatimonadota bacterium]|nr:3-isopropylmalate dehydratase small subunit [Armatimonadota bacterium]MDR5703351.1 3-isopropylmalate dehydratase small subunit [Armatimonadota bacterium]MDR7434260.1 3-isopropylmalate dehydratase small subunit [Armatimonadota bacterium]
MIFEGTALLIARDNVDTDVLYPGPYLNIVDPQQMKWYLFEGLDPSLRDRLREDTILVVGENFGAGSSREHVPLAMKAWGIRCLVGKSFARIFYRNCINLGLLAVPCREAVDAARDGSRLRIDTDAGVIEVDGRVFRMPSLPPFLLDIITCGGLEAWARRRLTTG